MTDRRPAIGIDRKIRLTWLDAAAGIVGRNTTRSEIRGQLDKALGQDVAGEGSHSARGKTLTVLLHIWLQVPPDLRAFRDHGATLFRQVAPRDRICLHWGMTLSTYPFFRDATVSIGRLLQLQGTVALSQLTRRMTETWGQRTTLVRAAQRVVRSLVEWEVLAESKDRGVYEATPQRSVPNAEIAIWMLESLLRGGRTETAPFRELIQSRALFPFSMTVRPALVRNCARLELVRQGLDEDVVVLRSNPEVVQSSLF